MTDPLLQAVRERLESEPEFDAKVFASAAAQVRAGSAGEALVTLLSGQFRAAFLTPALAPAVYDTVAQTWLGEGDEPRSAMAPQDVGAAAAPLTDAFWQAVDALLADARAGKLDAEGFTLRTAGLGAHVGEGFQARAEAAAYAYPAVADLAARPFPPRLAMATLENRPEGSLGRVLYDMLVGNGYQPEVFDRQEIDLDGLQAQPPALRYLNGRILSLHDVFHLVAGYRMTVLGEVGVSAFSLAQFGHPYSAMLVTVLPLLMSADQGPAMVYQVIAEAWRHGRRTPPLMAIDWDAEWSRPIEDIRARHGIDAYLGLYPQDLVEQARAQAAE